MQEGQKLYCNAVYTACAYDGFVNKTHTVTARDEQLKILVDINTVLERTGQKSMDDRAYENRYMNKDAGNKELVGTEGGHYSLEL